MYPSLKRILHMLKASFEQECFKANVLISFHNALVCSVEQPGSKKLASFWAKLRQRTSARSLLTVL